MKLNRPFSNIDKSGLNRYIKNLKIHSNRRYKKYNDESTPEF